MKKLITILFLIPLLSAAQADTTKKYIDARYKILYMKSDTTPVFFLASKSVKGQLHDPVYIIPGYKVSRNLNQRVDLLNAAKQPLRKDIKVLSILTKENFINP